MPNSISQPHESTKGALLDSAERLFALHGIDRTSLRAITQAAGANLASVNYHFGSKDGLVRAVFGRRLQPLNQRRIELLDLALADPEHSARLRRILHAFVGPVVEMRFDRQHGNPEFMQLMGRVFAESPGQPRREILDQFAHVLERFLSALSESVPDVDAQTLAWNFHFTVGAMAHTVAVGRPVSELFHVDTTEPAESVGRIIDRLVDFLEAAWTAPAGTRKGIE